MKPSGAQGCAAPWWIGPFARDASLSEPDNAREADLLLDRAEGDLKALESLIGDDDQADHVLGLLAQQSIEKSAKAVLVARGEESPHTHDLTYLIRLLRDVDFCCLTVSCGRG